MEKSFDWPGLLKWSMAYHDESTETNSDVQEMSASDRAFIQNAMDSMVMDELKRIKVLLHVLRLPEDPYSLYLMNHYSQGALDALEKKRTLHSILQMRREDEARKLQGKPTMALETITEADSTVSESDDSIPRPSEEEMLTLWRRVRDEKLDALDELQDRIGKRDNAHGLVVFNGLPILARALDTTDLELREAIFRLLALVVQHHPAAQDAACREHLVQLALSHLYVEGYSAHVPEDVETEVAEADKGKASSASSASVPTAFIPVKRSAFLLRPQIASSLGYAVIRAALYFLSSLLENHKPAQLVFLANAGVAKATALINLDDTLPAQDRYLSVRRRALGVLLTLVDECNEARVDEHVANALVELDGRAVGAGAVTLQRIEDEITSSAAAAAAKVAKTAAPAVSSATHVDSHVAADHQLVEVAEGSSTVASNNAQNPVVMDREHPSWTADKAHVDNTAADTVSIPYIAAKLVAPQLDLIKAADITKGADTTAREDLYKLISNIRAFAPAESVCLCKDDILISALEKRIIAIVSHCKTNPDDRAQGTDELVLIANAKKALAE